MAFRSISTRFILPRLENPETRRSKHLCKCKKKGGKKQRKQSRCISNNRNLKHIVAQSPVTHCPGTPSMYLPKAATSSRGSFFKRRPPRPLQRRQPITEDSRIKALATSLPESSKERPGRIPLVAGRETSSTLARSRLTSTSSTVLYRPNCGEASVYVRFPTRGKRFFTRFKLRFSVHPHLAAS